MILSKQKTLPMSQGTVHKLPPDLRKSILSSSKVQKLWEDITPLARNEWICWVENAKHIDTRKRRIEQTNSKLLGGTRRPCCWVGCMHREKTGR
jgi:uncharacterized protein YdeI (YjbR/CyaY-like superfamily)